MPDDMHFSLAKRLLIVAFGVCLSILAGYIWFAILPSRFPALGTVELIIIIFLVVAGLTVSNRMARGIASPYNTAEVEVSGPIARNAGGLMGAGGVSEADKIVEQIEKADNSSSIDALKVHLNTPGGEVVPSDDIRKAVEDFDGVTVAYAGDICASGGYWIATAADRIYARQPSLVGSIGVLGSNLNMKELADNVGVSYERIVAGSYKDAGNPLREMDDRDRKYLQEIVDGMYDVFVERVSDHRELTEQDVRDTEARVYLGQDAKEIGFVDELGDHEDVEEYIEERIDKEPYVKKYEPQLSFTEKIGRGAGKTAYMCGKGMASVFDEDDFNFRM
ncbi:MAG: signal peptide peptidase SppA [Halobacteria archaeon]